MGRGAGRRGVPVTSPAGTVDFSASPSAAPDTLWMASTALNQFRSINHDFATGHFIYLHCHFLLSLLCALFLFKRALSVSSKKVWKTFECITLEEYVIKYLESDVLLLVDVLEAFRGMAFQS